ncbi:hypothetical protein N0V88_007259 [Collariella sp. IMI 366227]|nr:hypothetical protein N0V88_007259 [Collariella sp. IMI 366227]
MAEIGIHRNGLSLKPTVPRRGGPTRALTAINVVVSDSEFSGSEARSLEEDEDEDEEKDGTHSRVQQSPPSTEPAKKTILEMATMLRPYHKWTGPSGKLMSTFGALLPGRYKTDTTVLERPWISSRTTALASLWQHIQDHLPQGDRVDPPTSPEGWFLLNQPQLRDLAPTGPLPENPSEKQIAGLLIQATGEHVWRTPCTECRRHGEPFDTCVSASREVTQGISGLMRSAQRACGACLVRKNWSACSVRKIWMGGARTVEVHAEEEEEEEEEGGGSGAEEEEGMEEEEEEDSEEDFEEEQEVEERPGQLVRQEVRRKTVTLHANGHASTVSGTAQPRKIPGKAALPTEADLQIEDWEMGNGRMAGVDGHEEEEFVIGMQGVFNIAPGRKCTARNWGYLDGVVHVTGVGGA